MARISDRELELRAKARWREDKQIWQLNVTPKGQNRKSFYSKLPGDRGRNEAASKALQYLNIGMFASPERVESNYAAYLDDIAKNHTQGYFERTEYVGRIWILPILGRKRLDDVTAEDIQDIINAAADKRLKRSTLSVIKSTLVMFFRWCKRYKKCNYLPDFNEVDLSEGTKSEEKTALTPDETLTLYESEMTVFNNRPAKDKYIHLYRFCLFTGLRPGECIGILPEDISEDFHTTRINKSFNAHREWTPGKNANAKRTIVNCEFATEELKAQAREYPASDGSPFFGCSSQSDFRHRIKVYCEANGIRPISPYILRHTFESYRQRPTDSRLEETANRYIGHAKEIPAYIHEIEGFPEMVARNINDDFLAILEYARNKRANRGTGVVQQNKEDNQQPKYATF